MQYQHSPQQVNHQQINITCTCYSHISEQALQTSSFNINASASPFSRRGGKRGIETTIMTAAPTGGGGRPAARKTQKSQVLSYSVRYASIINLN